MPTRSKSSRGRYYLSRVIKLGTLNQERLVQAILTAPVLEVGKFAWAITDAMQGVAEGVPFVFAKLAKYSREGHVTIVDPERKSQRDTLARNLLVASSPFVYLRDFSGVAFLHVWNGIQEDLFPKRFCALIQAAYQDFFVECAVEPVADYRAFIDKLDRLERITEMSAKVRPPNPLFGHLWGHLKEYVIKRNAEELSVREKKSDGEGLRSELRELMAGLIAGSEKQVTTHRPAEITDAALLMAADGYGQGKIVGEERGEQVLIRTSDTHKSFLFETDPDPEALAIQATRYFKVVSRERQMEH